MVGCFDLCHLATTQKKKNIYILLVVTQWLLDLIQFNFFLIVSSCIFYFLSISYLTDSVWVWFMFHVLYFVAQFLVCHMTSLLSHDLVMCFPCSCVMFSLGDFVMLLSFVIGLFYYFQVFLVISFCVYSPHNIIVLCLALFV